MVRLDKASLRKLMIEKRVNYQDKELANKIILDKVLKFLVPYQSIGIFVSFDSEVNTHQIIKELISLNKNVYTSRFNKNELKFYPINDFNELKEGPLNILWPIESEEVLKNDLEVMIIPLLAFDDNNYRLGYGNGYYDKYLSDYKGLKVGIAYHIQHVKKLPIEAHDIPLDLIITNI